MPSQEEIVHQQTLLNTYRRNLAHLERQAASYGSENAAPLHIVNSLDDTRANIERIKNILRGWGVKVDDTADQGVAPTPATTQQSSATSYPQSPANVPQLGGSADASFKYDVFISYSHVDEDWVEHTLLKTLEDAGLRACIDFRDFAIGRPAIVNMEQAVEQSKHTIIVMTQAWLASEWATFEALLAQTDDPSGLRQRLIPLRLEKVEQLPKRISLLTWVDFTRADRLEIAWRQLFTALGASGR